MKTMYHMDSLALMKVTGYKCNGAFCAEKVTANERMKPAKAVSAPLVCPSRICI
jgi:hypothetical protein